MKSTQNQRKIEEWKNLGQSGAKKLLSGFLTTTSPLPHAFLFFGPGGIGKYELAKEFADKLSENFSGPKEHYEFDFAEQNGVDDLRELVRLSSLTSAGSNKKIFLLKNFQSATTASLNSLLKTLEEPSAASLFLLISNGNSTLPTILSRVVPVRCFPVTDSVENSSLPERVRLSVKSYPKLSEKITQDSELAENYEQILGEIEAVAKNGSSLVVVNRLNELDSEDLRTVLLLWTNWLKACLAGNSANAGRIVSSLRAAQTATEELSRNFNTKLVLQEFLLQTKI